MSPAQSYILESEEPFRSILLHLQIIIEKTIPGLNLLYKYKIPFYYYQKRPFCYLNVPKNKKFVDLGFWNAAHLELHKEYMTTAGRKMMKSLRYHNLKDIDEDILISVLHEAFTVKDKKFWK